jgi:hypothetical protein
MPLVTRVSIGGLVRADVQVGNLCATGLSDVVRFHVTARCRAVHAVFAAIFGRSVRACEISRNVVGLALAARPQPLRGVVSL